MARQIVNIPTGIDLFQIPALWSAGRAEYVQDVNGGFLQVFQPSKHGGLKIGFEHLPPEIAVTLRRPCDVLICEAPPGAEHDRVLPMRKTDGRKMRDDFLTLDGTTEALLDFLNKYGEWGRGGWELHFDHDLGQWKPGAILPESVWYGHDPAKALHFREVIRRGLTCTPRKWFTSDNSLGFSSVGPQADFPHYSIQAFGCSQVILATITIDHLRQAKFRLCKRPDCPKPFAIKTKHERSYCCQYCAHIESVRRNRNLSKKGKTQ